MISRVVVMLNGLVVLGLSGADKTQRCAGILGVDQAYLCGLVVVHTEQQQAPAVGPGRAHPDYA